MYPILIPEFIVKAHPHLEVANISSPDGVPEDECGDVQALVGAQDGGIFDGGPLIKSYWKLTDDEIIDLATNGGILEVSLYANQMPMQAMRIVPTKEVTSDLSNE